MAKKINIELGVKEQQSYLKLPALELVTRDLVLLVAFCKNKTCEGTFLASALPQNCFFCQVLNPQTTMAIMLDKTLAASNVFLV